ncbi:MAG TPA: FGGY-family carbohydrate kinase, partial [Actinomycetales bacterium]|nr:FGGY-family carbohydrate kinase [Actinomycetales bacterium]
GRPLVVRRPGRDFTLGNFVRGQIYASFATLRLGMDILTQDEGVGIDKLLAHGGMFQTEGVAQQLLAGALNVPISLATTASEGGAWGIAVLAAYTAGGKRESGQGLQEHLDTEVFAGTTFTTAEPNPQDTDGFNDFYAAWRAGLAVERAAVDHL